MSQEFKIILFFSHGRPRWREQNWIFCSELIHLEQVYSSLEGLTTQVSNFSLITSWAGFCFADLQLDGGVSWVCVIETALKNNNKAVPMDVHSAKSSPSFIFVRSDYWGGASSCCQTSLDVTVYGDVSRVSTLC